MSDGSHARVAPRRLRVNVSSALLILLLCARAVAAGEPTVRDLLDQARVRRLSQAPTWAALLHANGDTANIQDPAFLLSARAFSRDRELAMTLTLLYGGDTSNVCRFPARYLWLRHELSSPALPIERCGELSEFARRAPIDRISLAFASESVAQPASMMGHVFLKLDGLNDAGERVAHAISFFTDGATLNVPKLVLDSIFIGMDGFFSLSPYSEKVDFYVGRENRSVWEYELEFDAFQRALIQAHLIELKQARLTYFFQKYNCATVINFVLAVGAGVEPGASGLWVSPKDVIKRANQLGLIRASNVVSPSRWMVRALSGLLQRADVRDVQARVERQDPMVAGRPDDPGRAFVRVELARAYHRRRLESGKVSEADGSAFRATLDATVAERFRGIAMEASRHTNPLLTPPDSQVAAAIVSRRGQPYVRLTFTPTSHHLEDDSRQYFSENELVLFEVSVLQHLTRPEFALDRMTLYSVQSLLPRIRMSGGLSAKLRIGIEPQLDRDLRPRQTGLVQGGVGLTSRLATDVDVYAIAGAGLGYRRGQPLVYANPEVGAIIREVFNMKSLVSVAQTASIVGDAGHLAVSAVQSKYFAGQRTSLHLTVTTYARAGRRLRQLELTVKKLF